MVNCKTCGAAIPMARNGQRYCSEAHRQQAYRKRQKPAVAVTQKRRLYPPTRCRNESAEIAQSNQGAKSPPTYYSVEARDMPPKAQKGMLPQSPPPPLSAVEIAALGGYVVTVKPRPYVAKPVPVPDAVATPGALQGDDYPLEYHPDGYPKLPACLDRRRPELQVAA